MLSQYSYLIMRMSLGEDDEYNIECTKRTTSIASFMYLDDDCNIGEYKKYNSSCSIVMVLVLNTFGTVS